MESPTPVDDGLLLKPNTFDESGWSRGWYIESGMGIQHVSSTTRNDSLAVSGFFETPDYGIFSIDTKFAKATQTAFGSTSTSNSGTTWRVDQRGLALNGGWLASHSIGDVSTTGVPLSRGSSRTTLPLAPIRGVAGRWSASDDIELNASLGEVGSFSGFDLNGFRPTGAKVASAGAQLRLSRQPATGDKAFAAVQLIDVRHQDMGPPGDNKQNTKGIYTAVSFEGRMPWAGESDGPRSTQSSAERIGDFKLQGNFLRSNQSAGNRATGLWADAQWRTERWRQSAGIFRFDPLLGWGEALLPSNLQGVYWRADTANRQWQFSGTSELSNSVNGSDAASAFFSGSVRYRIDRRNALNATINLRRLINPGSSVNVNWTQLNALGQTQWLSEVATVNGLRTRRMGVDQSLILSANSTLSASLAWEQTTGNGARVQGWTWGLLTSMSPANGVGIDGALRGSQHSDGTSAVNANIALSWQIAPGWSTVLQYTEARGQQASANLVTSALATAMLPPTGPTPAYRSLFLNLRYQRQAGSRSQPIGGSLGDGAGTISGTVFFDADNNGLREASEAGVPGVTVTLDRRYLTRTDAQGRYTFPYVAAKGHFIEISSDNVPLPWSPVVREPISIDVLVREIALQDFAVQRER